MLITSRKLRLSITRLGWQYLLALLLVGSFAVNTGNNLLYLIFAMMLGLFLVSGIVSRRALKDLRPLELDEGNLFARVRGGLRLRLEDGAPRRIRGLELHLEMDDGTVEPGFFAGGGEDLTPVLVLHARAERRGWSQLKSLEFRTRHPFGFLEKAWRFRLEQPVLVLPHPRTPLRRDHEEGEQLALRTVPQPGESSPEGARPLRQGDPPARVHWKRTAQRRQPWVRTFEEEVPQGLRLRLDLLVWGPGRAFERELERLSGAILQARLQKRDVRLELRSAEGAEQYLGPNACWRALARAEAQGAPGDAGYPDLDTSSGTQIA